jgi:diadenosine tetraphosphate (Ap4A) HIT family hydrolase
MAHPHAHDNIFAKMARGEITTTKVYEDEHFMAVKDIAPQAAVHILVFPKAPAYSFDEFCAKAGAEQVGAFFKTVQHVAHTAGLSASGYRVVTNHGAHALQVVPHFHVHILGGEPLGTKLVQHDHQADHGKQPHH